MKPELLLELFAETAASAAAAVRAIAPADRRLPGERPTQYALDLAADAAALAVLGKAPVAIVSEESGVGGVDGAEITVVLDPIDGSTNCSRGIPYWSTSIAAVDADGLLAATVVNHVNGEHFTATRGGGAFLEGERLAPVGVEKPSDALVCVTGAHRMKSVPFGQARTLGSGALELCEVGAGRIDGYVDSWGGFAPWDYLGGLLVCREAGVEMVDHQNRELVVVDHTARRQPVAATSPALLEALRGSLR